MDFLSLPPKIMDNGNVYDIVWTIVDQFSGYVKILPCSKTVTAGWLVQRFICYVYPEWGLPEDIVSDQDAKFTSKIWKYFCDHHNIHQSMSTAYHPRTDGQSEVANKAIIQKIKHELYDGESNWLIKVPYIQAKLNRNYNSSRKATPFEVIYGINPRLVGELVTQVQVKPEPLKERNERLDTLRSNTRKNLQQAKIDQSIQTNKRRRPAPTFKIGDLVLLSTKNLPLSIAYRKTAPEWVGPMPVTATYYLTDNYTVELPDELSKLNPTFHIENLKPYINNDDERFPKRKNTKPGPLPEFKDEERYEVEMILREKGDPRTGQVTYYVKWKG